jgi:hypothetical protein
MRGQIVKRFSALACVAVATVGFSAVAATGSARARQAAERGKATAIVTSHEDALVAKFQLDVLTAINCEELALDLLGSHPRLAREWLMCAEESLAEAASTELQLPHALHGYIDVRLALNATRDADGEAVLLSLQGKKARAREKVEIALRHKRDMIETIHRNVPGAPEPAHCILFPLYLEGPPKGGDPHDGAAPQGAPGYELRATCPHVFRHAILTLSTVRISGNVGYVDAAGVHHCRHTAHRVDCKISRRDKQIALFAHTAPQPSKGLVAVFGAVLGGKRVAAARTRPLGRPPLVVNCSGQISLLSAGPPPIYNYNWACDQPTTGFSITLPSNNAFLHATTPTGYTCVSQSANGGTNNQLSCQRTSGTTAANQSVNGQVQTSETIAPDSAALTVSPQNATFTLSGP